MLPSRSVALIRQPVTQKVKYGFDTQVKVSQKSFQNNIGKMLSPTCIWEIFLIHLILRTRKLSCRTRVLEQSNAQLYLKSLMKANWFDAYRSNRPFITIILQTQR